MQQEGMILYFCCLHQQEQNVSREQKRKSPGSLSGGGESILLCDRCCSDGPVITDL